MEAKKAGKLPKAIVVVHFAGASCEMNEIYNSCQNYNIKIIEDAAHGLGADYKQGKVGCCDFSDFAVVSFHPVKSITSAEGGAILCNDPELAHKCQLFAKHGITREHAQMKCIEGTESSTPNPGAWYYQQIALGFNYRLSDLHAALGLSQLQRLDQFIDERRKLAKRYQQELCNLPLKLPQIDSQDACSWHLFMVEVTEHSRKHVFDSLREHGVGVNVHYIPIHHHPFYQDLGFKYHDFPASVSFYENAITLPLYVGLSEAEQDKVISALKHILISQTD